MKKILLIGSVLFLIGCGGNDDNNCNCTKKRFDRDVVMDLNTNQVVSSTEWKKTSEEAAGNDCSMNGNESHVSTYNSQVSGSQLKYSEYKFITECK
jgi:hypothetical protein